MFRYVLVVGIAFAVSIGLAKAAPAGGVVGDGTPGSCTETALDSALAGGGTVTFNCGGPKTIPVLTVKNITQNTVIDGGGIITITGGLATALFHVVPTTTLTMSNITLDSAYNTNSSGGAIWSGGALTLTNVTIQNSLTNLSAQYCGGALIAAGETLIVDSKFNNNTAVLGGGAICVRSQPGTRVRIVDSSFFGNQAIDPTNGFGGALYVEYGTAVVRDSLFLLNSAHFGGAAYVLYDNAALTLEGSPTSTIYASQMQLNANSATEDGGALYNKRGALTINYAVISANQTPTNTLLAGYGGAIYDEGVLTLTNSVVSSNAGRYGGGLFVGNNEDGARALINRGTFSNNTSGNLGGGLYTNIVTTTITISNSVFNGNTAVGSGGGLARFNAALNIYNSSFTYNTAASGGGLFIGAVPDSTSGPYVRVQSVTVSDNTATSNQGGGVLNTGRAELYSMTIVTNTNGVWSGANGNTRFRDTVLQNPGFLNCDGDGTAQISNDGADHITDSSCGPQFTVVGGDPLLGPLAIDTFGSTWYRMPLAGSPLINAGFNCPERDQRNAARPDQCDIGAVEFNGRPPVVYLPLIMR